MPATDLALLEQAAREAGEIARRHFETGNARRWDKPGGAGPVTEADLAVNRHLHAMLPAARPDYGWLSEETEDGAERLDAGRVFVIDPIDGTRAFIEGSRDWAHSLAVVEAGRVTAAAVHLPMRDLTYLAAAGEGATLNGERIAASTTAALADATVLAAKPNLAGRFWRKGAPPDFRRSFRSSLAFRLCLVAEGRYDAMLTLRPAWEWDIAAGSLIVDEAGGRSSDQKGKPLAFNNPHPQVPGVVAGGAVQPTLLRHLA